MDSQRASEVIFVIMRLQNAIEALQDADQMEGEFCLRPIAKAKQELMRALKQPIPIPIALSRVIDGLEELYNDIVTAGKNTLRDCLLNCMVYDKDRHRKIQGYLDEIVGLPERVLQEFANDKG